MEIGIAILTANKIKLRDIFYVERNSLLRWYVTIMNRYAHNKILKIYKANIDNSILIGEINTIS